MLCFNFELFSNYGVPLHLIRELYETFRNFKIRIADYIRYRKITSNMNDRFPDATPEELNAWVVWNKLFCAFFLHNHFHHILWSCRSDATCIICREEMTTAKKLICGHLFHVHCLRSWLERQHTCPTCRAQVVPPENGASQTGPTGPRADSQQGIIFFSPLSCSWSSMFFKIIYNLGLRSLLFQYCVWHTSFI